jgi:glycosyltransferase involved in cell wall biosynthesis
MISVTALILTHNEKENIARTVSALPAIDEIVLVDSMSSDETTSIALAINPQIRVLLRAFDSHTEQWNFGLDQVRTEWVLTLDADYELSSELRDEITALNPPGDVNGYTAEFIYRISGHSLRGSSYPPRVVLFRVKQARYVDDGHTQLLQANGRIEQLAGKIYHDDRKPISQWIQAQDRYAILEARHLLSKPLSELNFQDRLRRRIFLAAPAMFLYLFFAKRLILDGWPGWFYVAQRTIAELLLSIRLLIERHGREGDGS